MPHPFAADFERVRSPFGIDGWEHRQTHGLWVMITLIRALADEAVERSQSSEPSITAPASGRAPADGS